MFRRKTNRPFPPGTFIPLLPRSMAIAHLCLTFTILLTLLLRPFLGDLYAIRSHLALYERVFAQPQRVAALEPSAKKNIAENQRALRQQMAAPFLKKVERSILLLRGGTSPWLLTWAAFSVTLTLLLLRRREGIVQAIWLLPLLASLYAVDNHTHGSEEQSSDSRLIPTEKELRENYLTKPLSEKIDEQRTELLGAWQRYLIAKWGDGSPSGDRKHFEAQLTKAQFAFNVARLPDRREIDNRSATVMLPKKQAIPLLTLFELWNVLLAMTTFWFRKKIIIETKPQGVCEIYSL